MSSKPIGRRPCEHPRDFGGTEHEWDLVYAQEPTQEPHLTSERLPRSTLFMQIAELFGRRSSCPRADVGCIAVLEGRIIASGYVGAPHGQPHCIEVGCDLDNGRCVRTVHAEANLVAWAARTGTALRGTTVWCTHLPCLHCTKLLSNAGVERVVWNHQYAGPKVVGDQMQREYGIEELHYSEALAIETRPV